MKRWKHDELAVAARLGGERVPVPGRVRGWAPDVEHPHLALEVKSRISQLKIIAEMMDQAEKAAVWIRKRHGVDRVPVGIYHVKGTRFDNAYVFMRLDEFEKMATKAGLLEDGLYSGYQ